MDAHRKCTEKEGKEVIEIQVWKNGGHGRHIKVHYDPHLKNWFFYKPSGDERVRVPDKFVSEITETDTLSNNRKLGYISVDDEKVLRCFSEAVEKQEADRESR